MSEQTLRQELSSVLNRHCAENASNTPDFLLADYLVDCLHAYEKASLIRERWYAKSLSIGGVRDLPENVGDVRLPAPSCTRADSLHDDVPGATPPLKERVRLLCDASIKKPTKIWLTTADIAELNLADPEVLGTELAGKVAIEGYRFPTFLGLSIESRDAAETRVE